jgi:nitrile hydratase beta subunit
MNGPHDLGGRQGHGPITMDGDKPLFGETWEGRMFGIAYCILSSGCHTIDSTRHAMEKMPHAEYLAGSYYEHWLYAYEHTMDERGLVTTEELERRIAEHAVSPPAPPAPADEPSALARRVLQVLRDGRPKDVPGTTEPRFSVGQRVRALNRNSPRHLRLPTYVKGRHGVVEAYYGHLDHPEKRAADEPDTGNHVYRVGFVASELWGPDAERPDDVVTVDLIEDYLGVAA